MAIFWLREGCEAKGFANSFARSTNSFLASRKAAGREQGRLSNY
jgi:hypothetical protein